MGRARAVERAFFPLDEELGLLAGSLTPRLAESVVRLGSWMPFARAAKELEHLIGVPLSEATVRRVTERAGADYVAVQEAEVERLEREAPVPVQGPSLQLMSVDGAFVPLTGKQWREVKTLVLGEVRAEINAQGEQVIRTKELSYFSRSSEASEFAREALVETHRRGVETAAQVCAVCDGAEWEQGFIDYHRPDAVRVLDFPHAAGRVAEAGRAVFGAEEVEFKPWLEAQCHQLKDGRPEEVLQALQELQGADEAGSLTLSEQVQYLEKRREMMRYAEFQALGYPIGSGSVESANKLVVEARLKQAGMHWDQAHVNPMVALRNVACNDRWPEAWPQIAAHQQDERTKRRLQRHAWPLTTSVISKAPAKSVSLPLALAPPAPLNTEPSAQQKEPKSKYRPPADHPWRRFSFGRGRYQSNKGGSSAKN